MGLVAIQPQLWNIDAFVTGTAVGSAMTAAGHKTGVCFQAPWTGTIDRVLWRSGTGGSTVTEVRLETVASGRPSNSLIAAGTNALQSGTSATGYETLLTNGASVTQGQDIAAVWAFNTGSISVIHTNATITGAGSWNYPSFWQDITGGGYTLISARAPNFALRYSDGRYVCPMGCWYTQSATASSTYSTGEQGIRFRMPFACTVSGLWHRFDPDTDITFKLYSDGTAPGGTTLASTTFAANISESTNIQVAVDLFNASVTLQANTWYRLVGAVSAASTRYDLNTILASSGGHRVGPDYYLTASSGASWIDTPTTIPLMGPIIDALDDGVGGSGGIRFPIGMNGGIAA